MVDFIKSAQPHPEETPKQNPYKLGGGTMQNLTPTLTTNPQLYDLDAIFDKAQIVLEQHLASDPKNVIVKPENMFTL